MSWNFLFFLNSILMGAGLAMDAFSVSLANGLNEPKMKMGKMCGIAGTFAFFQFAMPMVGWICVRTIVDRFTMLQKFVPYVALILLLFIGGKMLIEGIRGKKDEEEEAAAKGVGFGALMVQGIATSIDALSVGFTIAGYRLVMALVECGIIALVTFGLCIAGVKIGKTFGTKLAGKATMIGGIILICIGIEIFVKGVFF